MGKSLGRIFLITMLLILSVASILSNKVEFTVGFTFAMNGILALVMITRCIRKRAFSLELIHWIFFFLFLFLAGAMQYSFNGIRYRYNPTPGEISIVNILLFSWGTLFYIFNHVSFKKTSFEKEFKALKVSRKYLNMLTLVNGGLAVLLILKIGIAGLLFRESAVSGFEAISSSQTTHLIIMTSVRAVATFTFALAALRYRAKGDCIFYVLINLMILLVICSPLGLARYAAGTIYLGLILLLSNKIKKGNFFSLAFIGGMVFIFPALSAFRALSLGDSIFELITIDTPLQSLISPDYDAYTMFMLSKEFVRLNGPTLGMQLLGVVFFWLPRSLWPSKPIGSGDSVMKWMNPEYTNVSMPLPGEGYINFGLVGLVLTAILLGLLIHRLDTHYWNNRFKYGGEVHQFVDFIYPFLIPLFFFILRGDLLSTTAFTVGYVVVGVIIYSGAKLFK